jgi:hypothetical protein
MKLSLQIEIDLPDHKHIEADIYSICLHLLTLAKGVEANDITKIKFGLDNVIYCMDGLLKDISQLEVVKLDDLLMLEGTKQ